MRFVMYKRLSREGGGGGLFPDIKYVDMVGPKGYGFIAPLVRTRVSILAILVSNSLWVLHFGLQLGLF